MHKNMRLSMILLFLLSNIIVILSEEEIQSVEVGTDGEVNTEVKRAKVDDDPPKHPNSLSVIFENHSGNDVELYWDDSKDGILQGHIKAGSTITVNTFLGHRFYYTPQNSSGDKTQQLYESTMYEHTALITLYDEETMKSRGEQFEIEKSQFMKDYYDRTGIRWQNYYPREPVSYHYFPVTHIGQTFERTSDRTFFEECTDEQLTAEIITELDELERIWNEDPRNDISEKCKLNATAEDCRKVGPSFQMENDDSYIVRFNESVYCRPKNENVTFILNVTCATGPRSVRIFEFLTDTEIELIKNLGQFIGLKRSTVSEEALETIDRTSQTIWLERAKSFIVDNVIRRIAHVVGIPQERLFLNVSSESLQLVHYFGGELYKAHVDYGTDRPNNRYITFLMYLHNVTEGGYTSFPKATEECRDEDGYFGAAPTKRSVMFFYNLLPDGNVDVTTQHYAEPPIDSEKWMTNLWIWDKVFTR